MSDKPARRKLHPRIMINPPVFIAAGGLVIAIIIAVVTDPVAAGTALKQLQGWIANTLGWVYVMAVAVFLLFILGLAVSEYGRIKLGPDHSEPDYTNMSWFAMLFSAGMGIGLMFFAVAEPVTHYLAPPTGEGGTVEAARESMKITMFHWGVHAWAIYGVIALSLAYFAYRHNLPLAIRSSLYALIGDRIHGPVGHLIDTFAVLGTIFGVATSLGFGALQVNAGLAFLFDIPQSSMVQILLIGGITLLATLSVALGLDTGIRRISEFNMILAVLLLGFVLIAGPTAFLLQALVQNTGAYLSDVVYKTFNLYAYEPTGWIAGHTLFYWGWWIAWAPFVGMFIARVSRGRPIREFVVGVLLVPVGFTFMWMTFFGNTALHMLRDRGIDTLGQAVGVDASVAMFEFFQHLPFSGIVSFAATILVVTFFVTSSDSGSLVVDMLTNGGRDDSPVWQRVFWAILEGVVASVLLLAGGLVALQAGTIASALPFTLIMMIICWGLWRALRIDAAKRSVLQSPVATAGARGTQGPWQRRLATLIHHPRKQEVVDHIRLVARPALMQVAEELELRGMTARVEDGEDGRVWLVVYHGDEIDFHYSVRPRPYKAPSFVMTDVRSEREDELEYARAEIHLREGGQNYDIMSWTREQIIADVLDQYERHMHFLHALR